MNPIYVGVASSIVAEALKFIPFLRQNSLTKALTALVVTLIVSFFTSPNFTLQGFIEALGVACVTYLAVLQPAVTAAGFSSQG